MTQREADSGPSGRFIHSFTHSLNDVYWAPWRCQALSRHRPGTGTSEDESAKDPYPSSVNMLTEGDANTTAQEEKCLLRGEMPGGEYHEGRGVGRVDFTGK